MRWLRLAFVVAIALLAAASPQFAATAGVASDEADATAAGIAVLRAGGNAVDAAVATALALAVVHPEAGNLAGGGFAVVRVGGELAALDFRETAPAAATVDMFLDERGEPVPGASLVGPLAAGVPGSPTGLFELHRRHGRLPWADVVAPALDLARDGFELSARSAWKLARERDSLGRFPETAAVWLPGGVPRGAGERIVLPRLAATLADYASRGPEAITAGAVAQAVEAASRRHGGVLTAADLAAYRPVWRQPLRYRRFGHEIAAMPLPSSGGIVVGEALGVLENVGFAGRPLATAENAHLLIEALRGAFADRFLLGDPATTRARAEDLLAPDWIARRAAGLRGAAARRSLDVVPWTSPSAAESSETTHISVADGDGNLAALTTTLNDYFGCRLWVPEAGFFLNDQMDDFTTAPGRPNDYGLIQGEANAVAPGRRMLSSMSPMLLWNGNEEIAIGGRGGSRIITGVLQVLLSLFAGDPPQAAVARPRLHHQWQPDVVDVEEGGLSAGERSDLEARGYRFVAAKSDAKIMVVRRSGERIEVAADPRGPGVAATVGLAPAAGRTD